MVGISLAVFWRSNIFVFTLERSDKTLALSLVNLDTQPFISVWDKSTLVIAFCAVFVDKITKEESEFKKSLVEFWRSWMAVISTDDCHIIDESLVDNWFSLFVSW